MWAIFAKYDCTSEILMYIISVIFMFVMLGTKPKLSKLYILDIAGFITSCITIIVHFIMLQFTCENIGVNKNIFDCLYIVYSLLYISLLNEIFAYINLLSYKRRTQIKQLIYMCLAFSVVYLAFALYPLVTNKLYVIEDGIFRFTDYQYTINMAGFVAAILSMGVTIANKKTISNIVKAGVIVLAPIDIIILYLDKFFPTVYFLSFTYVMPFIMFFVLFHCSKYDDVIGCQNADAITAQIDTAIRFNKKYLVVYVRFPQLKKREYADIKATIEYVASSVCREIERFGFGIRLYSPNIYTYSLFTRIHNEKDAERIIEAINNILDRGINYQGYNFNVIHQGVVLRENPIFKKSADVINMIGYLNSKFEADQNSEFYVAKEKDYEKFDKYHMVEQALLDIRSNNNLDDERVLCYIQPIHNIETDSFRTGEALMRMKINGEMIFPDTFIPAAENNNCIHYLTKIILHKVCMKVAALEAQGYDFDAITVNCSTSEFEDKNLHNELYEIIENAKIDPKHIRLEITESIEVANYDNIFYNMEKLKERGISFYLDDFGTGYSNLERIVTYPFSTIKFDKSILYKAIADSKANDMMYMLVRYFKDNGLKTVVEGVEDKEQYEYCKKVGFDYIQGYLFSKPQPCDAITDYFTKYYTV